MTQTGTLAPRYYVARTNGNVVRYASLSDAKQTAAALYDRGVVAPLVIVAANRDAAIDKAARCYAGEITTKQARSL